MGKSRVFGYNVHFRRYIPPTIEDEYDRLLPLYFGRDTGSDIFDDDDFNQWWNENSSDEMKAWERFKSFCGDEGELCDKDGSYLLNKEGEYITEWDVDQNGFLIDKDGEFILYSDGTRVKEPDPEDYKPFYEKWFPKEDDID